LYHSALLIVNYVFTVLKRTPQLPCYVSLIALMHDDLREFPKFHQSNHKATCFPSPTSCQRLHANDSAIGPLKYSLQGECEQWLDVYRTFHGKFVGYQGG